MVNQNQLPEFDLVLFGGTGDLARRKLLPALYRRFVAGQFPAGARILGVSRSNIGRDGFCALIEQSCQEHASSEFDAQRWQAFAKLLDFVELDLDAEGDYRRLGDKLAGRDAVERVFFLSTAPALFAAAVDNLGKSGLVTSSSRIVLEKPLGQDQQSAERINQHVGSIFGEHQIYRIDHYLGKEAVQNLLALRFGNSLFEPLWRRGRICHVQITVAEDLGVAGRAAFYDQTGALRDMVQNHLLQLLCILAMEPPSSNTADAIRDEKLKVLRALRPLSGPEALANTIRGQYRAGAIDGAPVVGYLEEEGVPEDSATETYVALKAHIDSWRWAGVPFYLRTGKRLQDGMAEIVLTFDDVPHFIFEKMGSEPSQNKLVISLQPKDSITLTIMAKHPGEAMRLRPVSLQLDMADTKKTRQLDAYERLLSDVIKGNLTLFMRRDELDAAWKWIDPIRAAWAASDEKPKSYVAGSWGPAAASTMIGRDGFAWNGEG
ncbi:MAG TPA: glucose-6-phosphate dehydrogenase [Steroidobacteraceae bacterium]|nr:glucose-6-phosphate dehydrogenase [Steroidobacteraceae bacterium]